jgi:hypothetical protein
MLSQRLVQIEHPAYLDTSWSVERWRALWYATGTFSGQFKMPKEIQGHLRLEKVKRVRNKVIVSYAKL